MRLIKPDALPIDLNIFRRQLLVPQYKVAGARCGELMQRSQRWTLRVDVAG